MPPAAIHALPFLSEGIMGRFRPELASDSNEFYVTDRPTLIRDWRVFVLILARFFTAPPSESQS